jgi:hypothetical protein
MGVERLQVIIEIARLSISSTQAKQVECKLIRRQYAATSSALFFPSTKGWFLAHCNHELVAACVAMFDLSKTLVCETHAGPLSSLGRGPRWQEHGGRGE